MGLSALIGGGIGALGSLGGAFLQSNAAQQASQAQVGFGEQALAQLKAMFGTAMGAIQPVIGAGQGILGQGQGIVGQALGPLAKLLTPGADMTTALSQMPGFKFAQDWGQQGVANQATTTGLGGNALAAGGKFATGLAQQGYGQIVSQLQTLLGTGAGLEGTGASTMASGASALSGAASNFGGQIAGTLGSIGQSTASGILGSANALAGGLQSGASSIGNAFTLNALLSKLGQNGPPGDGLGGIYGQNIPIPAGWASSLGPG